MSPVDPTRTRLEREFKQASPLLACRFDPSGRSVVVAAQDNTLQRWDLASAKATALVGHTSWVRALAFGPRDRTLYSADYAGKLLAWPADADRPARTVEAHQGWVRAITVSPDGRRLATCGNDRAVRLWSLPDLTMIRELSGHDCHVYNVAFSPDSKQLASADLKGVVTVWDATAGTPAGSADASVLTRYDPTFRADIGGARGMTWSPDGTLLACSGITDVTNAFAGVGKPIVVLIDTKTLKRTQLLRPKTDFQGTAWGVVAHPDGFLAGVGGGNGGALWFWKPDATSAFHTLALPNNARDLAMHPDGRRLAVAFFDGAVRVYDMNPQTKSWWQFK